MLHSVVNLNVSERFPDYDQPWSYEKLNYSVGTGFAIVFPEGERYILTNAHCVQHSVYIECNRHNTSKKYTMTIFDILPDLDLALLLPEDDSLWQEIPKCIPYPFTHYQGQLLDLSNQVHQAYVVGYPQGGKNPSITNGIVSRYDLVRYSRGVPNIALQIDAAINRGNSGGPVFDSQQQLIGVAFSHATEAQNICYIIPLPLVDRYLSGIYKNGHSSPVCELGAIFSHTRNTSIRESAFPPRYLKEDVEPVGLIAIYLEVGHPIRETLQLDDILLSINGYTVYQDGSISMDGSRLPHWHIVRMTPPGEQLTIEFLRDKKVHKQTIAAIPRTIPRVPVVEMDIPRKYYIFAGIVFQPLNTWHILDLNSSGRVKEVNLCHFLEKYHKDPGDEYIIASEILPSKLTAGYSLIYSLLRRVNGIKVKRLSKLAKICEHPDQEFVKFEFGDKDIVILRWEEALQQSPEIALPYTKGPYHNLYEISEASE
jgi:S1-C subfamily serine protease